ncbi:MAG: AGE family epimerase/isomerase [Bacteroidota bacterium]|nr:AGE family epimerase/isomerase [Bacteroidota bacterium]
MIPSFYKLKEEVQYELTQHILPFWMERMVDGQHGGYFGRMNGQNELVQQAPKGAILNARILWTFSAAARHLGPLQIRPFVDRARDYIFDHFFDETHGGTYWMLNADGSPADTKKQVYSQAFFIYALVEYYRLTGDKASLDKAVELFELIEKYSFDSGKNGYLEAFDRRWNLLEDLRLSEKDANEKKTMNTHLHVLEAYTNLYRVYRTPLLARQLRNLILLFLEKIIQPQTHHLDLFFDENWVCRSSLISYGHDIEASWLLLEAAEMLGDEDLLTMVREESVRMAEAAFEGVQPDGSIINERDSVSGHVDDNRDWWPQAEAMVGFFNAWRLSGDERYSRSVLQGWSFIRTKLIDADTGEWFWSVSSQGMPDRINDKAGFWKCPYHNGRMCLELLERIQQLK